MRILVLQLARFGDIYQTWPTLHALKRTHPTAEIHVLVRERFRAALEGLDFVRVETLPSGEVLEPILAGGDEAASLDRLRGVLDGLAAREFTHLINLSFSPFSSFVTDALTAETTHVRGYSRFADGYFNPVDDFSAYFYAQVGVTRANRYHLTDIFAGVAEVELAAEDFKGPAAGGPRAGVVVHLGASQLEKTYPPELWAEALRRLAAETDECLILIGSPDERPLAEAVVAASKLANVINRVGETRIADLFPIVAGARLLIGADSGPVHVASLTETPVLNLSGAAVNFWETGPTVAGSRVLYADEIAQIPPTRVAGEAAALLAGRGPAGPCWVKPSRGEAYRAHDLEAPDDFAWRLIEALYTGAPYPETDRPVDRLAFQRLFEIAELALDQLSRWDSSARDVAAHQLALIDQMLPEIARMNPDLSPLVRWFETQRLRIGPGAPPEILRKTRQAFEDLRAITSLYRVEDELASTVRRAVSLGAEIAPHLREFEFAPVEARFNDLLSVLQDLARRSTNVGPAGDGAGWSRLMTSLGRSLAARDFIELADRLEHDLPRELQSLVADVLP